MTHVPIMIILLSLMTAFIMPLVTKRFPGITGPLTLGVVGVNVLQVALLLQHVSLHGAFQYNLGEWAPPWGIALKVDALALFMVLVMHVIAWLILLYAQSDLQHEIESSLFPWYHTLFLLLLAAMTGMSFSDDFFNIFVFTEISTITACAIIAIKPHRDCVEASLKYLILSTVGSGLVLFALALLYMVTGHLSLGFIAQELPRAFALYPLNIYVSLVLLVVGFGIKAALFPLHVWLPDAHSSAPSPSSAILSGVVVKVYALVLLRLIYRVYGLEILLRIPIAQVLLIMATLAIFMGSLFAIAQKDIKRMLAYSSVAQIGYIFLGVAMLTNNAVVGGLLHIANHAMMKSLLFLAAGAIIYKTGIRDIDELDGIGHRMPITMAAFSIGALAMIGIPGFNGFVSKFYLALGALDGNQPIFVAVILLSSLLNAAYYLPIVVKAFFGPVHGPTGRDELPMSMLIPLIVLGLMVLYTGILPGNLLALTQRAANVLFIVN